MNPLLIIDLEATCEKEPQPSYRYEIIEIGACWVSPSCEVLDTFKTLVRADQKLSEFCVEFLDITQAEVDGGVSFPDAAAALAEFANRYPGKTWASWGFGDLKIIERDCAYHGVENPLEDWAHRNLKLEYHDAKPKPKKKVQHVGMKRAMVELGIQQDGAHHRALPDALNIAKVFVERVRRESWKTDFDARKNAKFAANMVLMEIDKLDIDYPRPPPEGDE
ncbi:3'-5' exonuclease [Pseudomonas spirodelae]|uniref:3'-5' exonuclease n=1 Tax=Pseudomonas spirodelae TaxID=3101751 RepID=A0ABU5P7S1_9PSED|nr:3'-5' exonuclease [Pseudomonas sp. T5W1]MEA1605598.1 3'-5' exonuclease [Pseudomonas sp. T5W1]